MTGTLPRLWPVLLVATRIGAQSSAWQQPLSTSDAHPDDRTEKYECDSAGCGAAAAAAAHGSAMDATLSESEPERAGDPTKTAAAGGAESAPTSVSERERQALSQWAAFMKAETAAIAAKHPELDRDRVVRLAAARAAQRRADESAASVTTNAADSAAGLPQATPVVDGPGADAVRLSNDTDTRSVQDGIVNEPAMGHEQALASETTVPATTTVEREASAAGCPKWSEKESGGPGAFAEVDFGACISIAFRDTMRLARVESAYQEVEVYNSTIFGHILVIDGALMITERDEVNYHEMLVHTSMAYLPDARRVLVIGGGDGGTVTQLAKHPNLREIVWIEIDEAVIHLTRQYFPRLLAVENDPRVKLIFEDGAHYVRSAADRGERFDAVLIDSTDFSQAAPLFTNAFYQACRALVAPSADRRGGIVAYNVDSPQWHEPWVVRAHTQANELFVHAHLFQVYQPTFSSGHYSFMLASDSIHPFRTPPDWAAFEAKQIPTEYYSPDVHYAAFVLPAALQRRLGSTLRLQDLASAPHAFSQSSS